LGQSEFQRIWGTIPLEDNWRRSNKTPSAATIDAIAKEGKPGEEPKPGTEAGATAANKEADEVAKLLTQLPTTETQKKTRVSP